MTRIGRRCDVTGVRDVFNLVTIKRQPFAKEVERQIISAFDRQAALHCRRIVSDGRWDQKALTTRQATSRHANPRS